MTTSFSNIPRVLSCGWELSPAAVCEPVPPGDDAHFGTAVHEAALMEGNPDYEVLARLYSQAAPELRSYAEPVRKKIFDELPATHPTETAWALDPITGMVRYLGSWIDRKYEVGPDEIPGTVDIWWYEHSGDEKTLVVADLKTGHSNYVTKPSENGQLLAGACAIAAFDGFTGPVRLELWFSRPGGIWVERDTVSGIELLLFRDKLSQQLKRARGGLLSPKPGDHCKYCPARKGCPAMAAVAEGIVGIDKYRFQELIVDDAHAAWLVDRLALAKKVVEGVDEALKRYADAHGGIACADGKVWKAVDAKRTGLNNEAVKARLGDEYEAFTVTREYKTYRKVKA